MPIIVYKTKTYNMQFKPTWFIELIEKYGRPLIIIFEYQGAYAVLRASQVDDIIDAYRNVPEAKKILNYRETDNPVKIYWDSLKPLRPNIVKHLIDRSKKFNKSRKSV